MIDKMTYKDKSPCYNVKINIDTSITINRLQIISFVLTEVSSQGLPPGKSQGRRCLYSEMAHSKTFSLSSSTSIKSVTVLPLSKKILHLRSRLSKAIVPLGRMRTNFIVFRRHFSVRCRLVQSFFTEVSCKTIPLFVPSDERDWLMGTGNL